MKPVLFAVFFACVFAVFPADAGLYACIGPDGKKSYKSAPDQPGCVQQQSYEPGAPKVAPPPKPPSPPKPAAKTRAPSPPKKITIPDINPREQSGRDLLRRQILVHELRNEIRFRDAYRKHIGGADRKARAHYRRLIRVHELNILAIQGELNLLGANSARH